MKRNNFIPLAVTVILFTLLATLTKVDAQQARYKMSTDIPASITTQDVVETSLGTLRSFGPINQSLLISELSYKRVTTIK